MTPVVVLGLGGLDWSTFDRLSRTSTLPNLARLRAGGLCGPLGGGRAAAEPGAWATMASGLHVERHGIWLPVEAGGGGVRATGRASWRASPLWLRLEAAGVATGSVGWPALRPGAAWPGLHVDAEIAEPSGQAADHWALPPDCAPAKARAALRPLRVHPADIDAAMLRPFVPSLDEIDQSRDATLPVLATQLAQASTLHAASVWLLESRRAEVSFLHQPWLGEVRRTFRGLAHPLYADLIPAAWRFVDALVGRLADAATAQGARLLIVSPGWERGAGVVLAVGPGIALGAAPPVGVLDIAPVILAWAGLQDAELAGSAPQVFGRETVELQSAPDAPLDPAPEPDEALITQAKAQGFTPPPPPPPAIRAAALAELASLVLLRDSSEALRIAGRALALDGGCVPALRLAARAMVLLGETEGLDALAERLTQAAPDQPWGRTALGAWHLLTGDIAAARPLLSQSEAQADLDGLIILATLWAAAGRWAEAKRILGRMRDTPGGEVTGRVGLAALAIRGRDYLGAETLLGEAHARDPAEPSVYIQWSRLCVATARPEQAQRLAALARRFGASEAELPAPSPPPKG